MALINSAGGKTTVVHLYGTTRITTASNSVTITRPGYYAEASGAQVSSPRPAPAGLVASYNAQLQSKTGQIGGTNRGHLTSEKLRNIINGTTTGSPTSPSEQQYQSNVRTEPQATPTPTALAGGIGGISRWRRRRGRSCLGTFDRAGTDRKFSGPAGWYWDQRKEELGELYFCLNPFEGLVSTSWRDDIDASSAHLLGH
jgi:hypothetical protein